MNANRSQQEVLIQQVRMALRATLRRAAETEILTPEVVAAYAALHLATDDGIPITPAAHHWLWLRFLCDPHIRRLLIIAPPESAKTTVVISAYVGAYISLFPERSVIIGSATGPIAEKRSLSLRNTVLSQAWQMTFPTIRRASGMPWLTNEWSLAPKGKAHAGRLHPTLSAYGTGGSVIGARADLVIADDLLDENNSRTKYQRDAVELWFHRSFLSRRKAQTGRVVVIGTAWHHDDLYAHLKADGGWVVVHTPLLSDTDEVYATIQFPDDYEGEVIGEPIGAELQHLGIEVEA